MSKKPGKPSESLVQELLAERRQLKVALERARLDHRHVRSRHRSKHREVDAPAACLEREDDAHEPEQEPDESPDEEQDPEENDDDREHPENDVDGQRSPVDHHSLGGVVLDVGIVLACEKKDEASDWWEKSPGKNRVQVLVAGRAPWRCAHWRRLPGWRRRDLRH